MRDSGRSAGDLKSAPSIISVLPAASDTDFLCGPGLDLPAKFHLWVISEIAGGDSGISHQVATYSFGKEERDSKKQQLFVS